MFSHNLAFFTCYAHLLTKYILLNTFIFEIWLKVGHLLGNPQTHILENVTLGTQKMKNGILNFCWHKINSFKIHVKSGFIFYVSVKPNIDFGDIYIYIYIYIYIWPRFPAYITVIHYQLVCMNKYNLPNFILGIWPV